jgi:hypothetical protein
MRFVGILAIEREAESAENADFQGFLPFPATAGAVLRPKFRSAARLYPELLPWLTIPTWRDGGGSGGQKLCVDPAEIGGGRHARPLRRNRAQAAPPATDFNVNSPVVITLLASVLPSKCGCDADGGVGDASRSAERNLFSSVSYSVFRQMPGARAFP